jgi:signal transduction histidine kinase
LRGRVIWTKALAVDRSGRVWAAAMGAGVLRFEDGAFHPEMPWPPDAGFSRVLYQDRTDRWWLGSDRGLHCWTDGRWETWGASRGVPAKGIRAITEDTEGRLWVATYGAGVALLDGDRFVVFRRADGLPHDSVYALCAGADGSLWVGTHGGLARRRHGRFTRYTMAQGLPDPRVVQVLEDRFGFLWLGTRDGLCRIPLASLDAAERGKSTTLDCLVFDQKDGLPTRLFQDRSAPACWRARDGRLWFLTAGAAVYCRPEQIRPNLVKPSVTIEEVIINGQPWTAERPHHDAAFGTEDLLAPLAVKAPSRIRLPPGAHLIEIRYTAPSLVVTDDVRFEHRLYGLDSRWCKAGSQRSVLYSALPPGAYRFRVRASNNDGTLNPVGAGLELVIDPHFWQTKWFPALVTLLLVGGTGGAGAWLQHFRMRRRMARLELQRAREAERTRISRDLHDHLGASLTEVGMLAADGAEVGTPAAQPATALRAIGEKVQAMIGDLDSLVWAIDPQKDTLPALVSYLTSSVSEFCASSGLDCRLDVQRELPPWPVRSETRHNLFLAVKEAAHNAVRHAGATRLVFRLTLVRRQLELTLQDNGRGFDPLKTVPGNGLVNLRERLTYLGGRCDVAARPGEGTVVRLVLPLRPADAP